MALTVICDGRDVTALAGGLTFSSVDPGGYEACSFTVPGGTPTPAPGATVRVFEGLTVAWEGMVEDPGPALSDQRQAGQVSCVGFGAALKDNPYRMIYVDRDLSQWRGPGTQRQATIVSQNGVVGNMQAAADVTNGLPAIVDGATGPWGASAGMRAEAYYDALISQIASVYYNFSPNANVGPTDTNWQWHVLGADVDDGSSFPDDSPNLRAASGSGYYTFSAARRFAVLQLAHTTTTTDSLTHQLYWRNPAVYGNHGLTRRGSDPGGFYPADIAGHALTQVPSIAAGQFDTDPNAYIALHAAYRDLTLPETVVDDMAKLLGWHWGVWEALSMLGSTPRLDFRARPSSPTAVVSRSDCENLQISERRSQLYDTCTVTYTDAAGTQGAATVVIPNPRLPSGTSRTLQLAMGIGSSATATALATMALELAQASQRGGGAPLLPGSVLLPGGGSKPAHLLKAGLDRLRITDLPDSGPITAPDSQRFDTFRIARVETSVQRGVPRTTVEIDEGADLLETLTARLAIAATLAGPSPG